MYLMECDPFFPFPIKQVHWNVPRNTGPYFMFHVPLLRLAVLHKSYVQLWHSRLC